MSTGVSAPIGPSPVLLTTRSSSLRRPSGDGRLLLLSPWAYDTSFKTNIADGDIYGLWAHARRLGVECSVVDGHQRSAGYPDLHQLVRETTPVAVLVHLWTADNYGEILRRQCEQLAELRRSTGVAVVAFGYLAVTAVDDIIAAGAVDAVRLPDRFVTAPGAEDEVRALLCPGQPVPRLLDADSRGFAPLRPLPADAFARLDPATIVAVRASRGCRARCSFCSYNADVTGGWVPRDMREVVDDIGVLVERAGVRRVALSDADFGGSASQCRERADRMRTEMERRGLAGRVRIALATRPATLSHATLVHFAAAGVDTMLVGLETLDARALRDVFTKRHGQLGIRELAHACDSLGISLVASYILWHPWQTLEGLRRELDEIIAFGRHRVPQFLARSVLQVQPGTLVEQRLASEGLLASGPFHRAFTFADSAVAKVYSERTEWYERHAAPVLRDVHEDEPGAFEAVARLKVEEVDVLAGLLRAEV